MTRSGTRAAVAIFGATAVLLGTMCVADAAEPMDAGKAFVKAARGGINLLTGWVEIPKRIQETSTESGTAAGFTWGLLRGIGHGFIRTAAGAYELVTFPFPAPPEYKSVIQPEYVFSDAEPAQPRE